MISSKYINKKPIIGRNNIMANNKSKNTMNYQQQNSIKNYLMFKPSTIPIKNNHPQTINFDKSKSIQNHINDENCSYNANITQLNTYIQNDKLKIQTQPQFKLSNQPTSDNLDHCNISQKFNDKKQEKLLLTDQINTVINLKKKIKKCDHLNNFFREKVTFKKKIYKIIEKYQSEHLLSQQISDKQNKIEVQQVTQTFFMYRDTEIFTSLRSKQLRNKLVVQRMDNDTQTDDEQVQKFVKKMSTDFVQHVKKVQNQNPVNYQSEESSEVNSCNSD